MVEIMEFIVKTNNPVIFGTFQSKSKDLYKFDEYDGWTTDFTDEKIIDLLFQMVKNLDKQNEMINQQLIDKYNTCTCQKIFVKEK